MNKIAKPSFTLGYWKPFDENQNFYDSYQLYIRDVSLQEYNAKVVGSYIEKANNSTVQAISDSTNKLGYSIERTNNQLNDISYEIKSMIYSVRLQIEQQKATNILLNDIKSLLRLPDSEKERLYAIELGLKFFSNAKNDKDLFTDALNEFLKAEHLMSQDYFVLHRIGLIYLLTEEHLNVEKALEYFKKAAKYASVESNINIKSLAYLSNDHEYYENTNTVNLNIDSNEIQKMASESYEKAAFAAYILGDTNSAISLQEKAQKLHNSAQNNYFLGKYLIRSGQSKVGIKHLDSAVEYIPETMELIIKDLDLNTIPEIIEWLNKKVDYINHKINYLKTQWKNSKSPEKEIQITSLGKLLSQNYSERVHSFQKSEQDLKDYINIEEESKKQLTELYNKIQELQFFSKEIDKVELLNLIQNFKLNKNNIEMDNLHSKISQLIIEDNRKRQENSWRIQKEEKESEEWNETLFGIFIGLFFGCLWVIPAFTTKDSALGILTSLFLWCVFWFGVVLLSNSQRVVVNFVFVYAICSFFWVLRGIYVSI